MPCMCGDICCPSCGPAQGNFKCLVCGAWASDGCKDQEDCEKKMPAAIESQNAADDAFAESLRKEQEEAEQFWNGRT